MEKNTLIKYGASVITFFVIISFFLFSILIPFNQIFPNNETFNIQSFSWLVSLIFLIDFIFKIVLLTNNKIKNEFLAENDLNNYLKSYFIFDFLAIIPIAIFPNPSLWQLLPLIKIISMFRRVSFVRQTLLKFASMGVVFQFLYWFAQITHWISCGWLKIDGINENQTVLSNYISALYWTTTTLTTVGYGDIVPHTNIEKLYSIFVMIIGVGFYGYLIGNVVSVITKRDPAYEKFINNLENLAALVKYRNLPKSLATRIKQYFLYLWKQKLGYHEESFLEELPDGLKLETLTFLRQKVFKNLDLFKDASTEFITELSENLKEIAITPGEFLFKEGDIGNKVYFVIKGDLSVLTENNSKEIAKINKDDFFGEIALFKNRPRNASVKAITFCHLYYLEKDSFDLLIPKYPSIASKIEAKVLERETSSE